MNPKPRRRYTAEFKARAVELLQAGRPAGQIVKVDDHNTIDMVKLVQLRDNITLK